MLVVWIVQRDSEKQGNGTSGKRSFSSQHLGTSAIDAASLMTDVKKLGKEINVKFALDNMGFFTL